MTWMLFQCAALRAALTWSAASGPAIAVDGCVLDLMMAGFVRLARRARGGAPPPLSSVRSRFEAGALLTGLRSDRTVRTEEVDVAGRPGRRYVPPGRVRADLLYFHGGGFILGSIQTHDALCRFLAARASVRVVAVEYRLAPEHPFPAGHDDAAAAWAWAQAKGGGPWLVAGDSAGANLAAAVARDGSPFLQMLIYPVVDMLHIDGLYRSMELFAEGFILEAAMMRQCVEYLLPPGQDAADPRLSPIRSDLSRAAPALVVTAGFDPLRDQGRAYAAALTRHGIGTHLLEESGLVHGFADFAGVVPEARRAVARIGDALAREFDRRGV